MAVRLDPPAPPRALRSNPAAVAFCLLLAALVPALCECGDAKADADAIRSLVNREVAAINGKDMRSLSEIWSQDKNILLFDVPPPGRFQGWDQIGRLWKDFFDRVSDIHLTVDAVRAEAQGSLGYATYDWAMTGRLGSYHLEDRGQATAVYRKEGGQWKLVHAHYSPVPPALAGQETSAVGAVPAGSATPAPGGAGPSSSPHPVTVTPSGTPSPGPTATPPGSGAPKPAASPAAAGSPASGKPPKSP